MKFSPLFDSLLWLFPNVFFWGLYKIVTGNWSSEFDFNNIFMILIKSQSLWDALSVFKLIQGLISTNTGRSWGVPHNMELEIKIVVLYQRPDWVYTTKKKESILEYKVQGDLKGPIWTVTYDLSELNNGENCMFPILQGIFWWLAEIIPGID